MSIAIAANAVQQFWRRAVQTARLAIGVPDYDTYVLHLRRNHPERVIPSYEEFFRQRQDARYKNGGTRGCC
ncbi:YbdD/YjiX family protein [Rudaea sp.]|uniref:YbdD/YjiX family protein n=1 Tax=Rudaea sp. TaxID=2136325 RepID=UPI002ECFDA2C